MVRKRTRRFLLLLGAVVGLFLILVLALPLWFPWVLRQAAPSYGLQYSKYERVGYSRFELSGVTFTNQTTVFKADQVEGFMPTAWLWNLYVTHGDGDFAHVQGWNLTVRPTGQPGAKGREPSVY